MTPFSAAVPLRTTAVWGGYAQARVIPHRYGATAGELLRYDVTGLTWVWADHASAGIDRVTVGGRPASAWSWRNGTDSTGSPVTFVTFNDTVSDSDAPMAEGRGKRHAMTGELLENPADVLADLLTGLAGRALGAARLEVFRAECLARGLLIGGSLDSAAPLREVLRAVCDSVGAIFVPECPRLARLWPGGEPGPARYTVPATVAPEAQASLSDLVTDITLRFDVAGGQPRQTLRMVAPDAVVRYGTRAVTVDVPWISSARVAFDVAQRRLQQYARPQWHLSLADLRAELVPGDDIAVAWPLPASPAVTVPVLSVERSMDTARTSVDVLLPVGDTPAVQLREQAALFAPIPIAISATTVGSDRIITLRAQEDGTPLAGAAVTIDGTLTRTSDAAGRVVFPAAVLTPGQHRLDIVTQDGRSLSLLVVVDASGNFAQTVLLPPPTTPNTPPPGI